MFIDTKPQGYSYDTSDETVINQLRSLPERTKKLNSQEAKCFTQIFDKLVATKPEGGGFSGGDAHLSSTEREEFAALINTMDVQHMIHWKKISVMCTPPSMSYTLYNFPVNPVEAVLQVVNYHKSRLASNGATSITIGRVKSSDIKKLGIYIEIDTSKEIQNGYPAPFMGWCGTGALLKRIPADLESFTIVNSADELSDIGLINIID